MLLWLERWCISSLPTPIANVICFLTLPPFQARCQLKRLKKHVKRHVHKKATTWSRPVSACFLPCQITGTVVYLFSPPMIAAILKTIHSAASFCSDTAVAGKVTDFFLAHYKCKCNLFKNIVSLSSPLPTNAAQKHVNGHVHRKATNYY